MNQIRKSCQRMLGEAGIATEPVEMAGIEALVFEGVTVLGFIFIYPDAEQLLQRWTLDANELVSSYQFGLRRAESKAWNTYTVFLTGPRADLTEQLRLSVIEEDLAGTRKIARAGVGDDTEKLRAVLLPLLPIQNAPRLEAVDMRAEIRVRTSELPPDVVDAFLSEAPESSLVQMLEEFS